MSDDIFSQQQEDPNKDYLSEYVGEGRKFKDVAALARGKAESDRFIEQVLKEKDELKKELDKRLSVEESIARFRETPVTPTPEPVRQEPATGLTQEDITRLLDERLQREKAVETANRNVELVRQALADKFGPSYNDKLEAKAVELGVDREYFNQLAKTQPKVLLGLINGGEAPKKQAPVGLFDSPRFPTAGQKLEKNFAYYEKMRKENPKLYSSPEVQKEQFEMAKLHGRDFYKQ